MYTHFMKEDNLSTKVKMLCTKSVHYLEVSRYLNYSLTIRLMLIIAVRPHILLLAMRKCSALYSL